MIEMNKVFLCGNLTADPDYRNTASGLGVASLRLAVNRRGRFDRETGQAQEETLFIDVTAWDKLADFSRNYLSKGRRIFVEGRLKMDQWQDKETGSNRSKITVVAERIQFADSKPQGEGGGAPGGGGRAEEGSSWGRADSGGGSQAREEPSYERQGTADNTEDDLPF